MTFLKRACSSLYCLASAILLGFGVPAASANSLTTIDMPYATFRCANASLATFKVTTAGFASAPIPGDEAEAIGVLVVEAERVRARSTGLATVTRGVSELRWRIADFTFVAGADGTFSLAGAQSWSCRRE